MIFSHDGLRNVGALAEKHDSMFHFYPPDVSYKLMHMSYQGKKQIKMHQYTYI
jgi:hypothetical protein